MPEVHQLRPSGHSASSCPAGWSPQRSRADAARGHVLLVDRCRWHRRTATRSCPWPPTCQTSSLFETSSRRPPCEISQEGRRLLGREGRHLTAEVVGRREELAAEALQLHGGLGIFLQNHPKPSSTLPFSIFQRSFLMVTVPNATAPDSNSSLRTSSNRATTVLAGFQPDARTGPRRNHLATAKSPSAADAASKGHRACAGHMLQARPS